MDPIDLHVLPRASVEPIERDLAEIDAAIAMVRGEVAERVRLVGLIAVDRVIGTAVAHAQAADVEIALDRHGAVPTLTIGPRH